MSKSLFSWSRVFAIAAFGAQLLAQQIAVEDTVISDFQGGFGVPATYEFSSGQIVHLAFRVRGFQIATSEQPRPTRRVALTYTVEAVDCSGRLLAPPRSGDVDQLLSARDPNWAPLIQHSVELPATPRAGTHSFWIRIQDKNSGATASMEVPFEVQSPFDNPSETLSVERFRFYKSSSAEERIEGAPVFRPGESVWGRFLLSGFRTGEGNRFDLSYAVSVRNSAGRVVLHAANAAAESRESFYPKTHVPGVVGVVLEQSIRRGSYVLVLTAVDAIGKQQVKAEYPFRVGE